MSDKQKHNTLHNCYIINIYVIIHIIIMSNNNFILKVNI